MKGPLLKSALVVIGVIVFLYWVLPLFTAPLPASLIWLYIALTVSSILIFVTMSASSLEAFMGPITRFLTGEGQVGIVRTVRIVFLVLVPFLVGWGTYATLAPSDEPPIENRTIHPAPPGEFVGLSNPLPNTPENITAGQGRYFSLCFPCHGVFDGKGPAAVGFNPPPADFKDSGTIAQLQESFLFWRIKKGGVGLPVEGMPWKSAMPRWEFELSDEEIWKIIMGEYAGSGHKPRTWEEEEEEE